MLFVKCFVFSNRNDFPGLSFQGVKHKCVFFIRMDPSLSTEAHHDRPVDVVEREIVALSFKWAILQRQRASESLGLWAGGC